MFESAGPVGSVGVRLSDGGADVADGGGVDGGGVRPSAVAGSNWSGESGSEGGVSGVGEAWIGDDASDIGGGVLNGWARGRRNVHVGEVMCRVDGGVAEGGLAGPDGDSGERMILLSSSESRTSSSSLRRRLVLFEGGG
jgi:hypothetical protein